MPGDGRARLCVAKLALHQQSMLDTSALSDEEKPKHPSLLIAPIITTVVHRCMHMGVKPRWQHKTTDAAIMGLMIRRSFSVGGGSSAAYEWCGAVCAKRHISRYV